MQPLIQEKLEHPTQAAAAAAVQISPKVLAAMVEAE
jgi:hypothetical protein